MSYKIRASHHGRYVVTDLRDIITIRREETSLTWAPRKKSFDQEIKLVRRMMKMKNANDFNKAIDEVCESFAKLKISD